MTYEIFFVGVGGTVLGALLGAWFAYRFQQKLLRQQLDFQHAQGEADAALRKQIAEEIVRSIKELSTNTKDSLASVADSARRPPAPR